MKKAPSASCSHDRAGRLLTHLSALDVAYYRRLNDTAQQPPNPE